MKVSILDDYHDTLRTLDCFRGLDGHEVEATSEPDPSAQRRIRMAPCWSGSR